MIEYKLYFGLNVDGKPTLELSDVTDFLEDTLSEYIEGYSIHEVIGLWMGKQEKTVVLSVVSACCPDTERILSDVAKAYARQFNQDCVLYTRQEIQTEFIGSE